MDTECRFYLCLSCFDATETPGHCHGKPMMLVDACGQRASRRRPGVDASGRLSGRAPAWYVEARSDASRQRPVAHGMR